MQAVQSLIAESMRAGLTALHFLEESSAARAIMWVCGAEVWRCWFSKLVAGCLRQVLIWWCCTGQWWCGVCRCLPDWSVVESVSVFVSVCAQVQPYSSFCVNPDALHICVSSNHVCRQMSCMAGFPLHTSLPRSLLLPLPLLFLLIHHSLALLYTSAVNHGNVTVVF